MAVGKKTSSKKRAEVINAKISNPDLSLRDMEKETGVNYETVRKILKEDLGSFLTSSDTIAKLVEQNNLLMIMTGDKLIKDLDITNPTDIIRIKDLALKQNKLIESLWDDTKEIKVTFEM